MVTKQSLMEYALAIIGAIIAVYICLPFSKDGDAYLEIYENIFDYTEVEFLFRKWLELGAALEISFISILFPLVFFTLLLKLKAIKQFGSCSAYGFVAYIAIFYLLHDCTQLRISAALAFALWSCIAIIHRKWLYALLLSLAAVGFHISSILLPIVFAACFYSNTVKKYSWLFLLLGFLSFQLKISNINILTSSIMNLFGGRYTDYTELLVKEQNSSGLAFIYATLLSALLIFLYYWGKANSKILPKSYSALLSTCVYGCGLLFWFYETVAVASRLSDVLLILIVPLLAIVISNLRFVFQCLATILLCGFFSVRILQLFVY